MFNSRRLDLNNAPLWEHYRNFELKVADPERGRTARRRLGVEAARRAQAVALPGAG
jgi:hypothetical protein